MKTFFLSILLLTCSALFAQSGSPGSGLSVDAIPLGPTQSLHGLAGTATAVTYTVFGVSVPSGVYGVLAQGQLATTDSTLYSVPPNTTGFLSLVLLANSTGSAVTGVTLGVNGSAATGANQILPGVTIPALRPLRRPLRERLGRQAPRYWPHIAIIRTRAPARAPRSSPKAPRSSTARPRS